MEPFEIVICAVFLAWTAVALSVLVAVVLAAVEVIA